MSEPFNHWSDEDLRNLKLPSAEVTDAEMDNVRSILKVWKKLRDRNLKRTLYYDAEQPFKDLGIALPPQLKNASFVLDWPQMAVRKAAVRSQYQGLRLAGSDDPFEMNDVLRANNFQLEVSQSINSAYKHGVSLMTVGAGAKGEAPVIFQSHSAENSAAIWSSRKRRIELAVTIGSLEGEKPTAFTVYMDHVVLDCKFVDKEWAVQRIENYVGRTLVEPFTYDPQLAKPFGRSRITKPVMTLTDMGVRALVRMEGNAELYSFPALAVEGADEDMFDGNAGTDKKFQLALDRVIALTRDADGNSPSLKQLQQATMTPHSDMFRTVATAFSGATGIPPNSLGVLHDNPNSAEAIRAAEHDLLIDATFHNEYVHSTTVENIVRLGVMVRDRTSEPNPESWKLTARFKDPEFRSMSATADGVQKLSQAMEQLQKHPVLLEKIFDEDEVQRVLESARRSTSSSVLDRLLTERANAGNSEPDATPPR